MCACIFVITNVFEWKTLTEQVAYRVEAKKKHAESDLAESAKSVSVSAGNNVYLNGLLYFFQRFFFCLFLVCKYSLVFLHILSSKVV